MLSDLGLSEENEFTVNQYEIQTKTVRRMKVECDANIEKVFEKIDSAGKLRTE